MNQLDNKILGILDSLSLSQIEILKDDIKKIYEGKHIFYVTDTYDIVNYALPFLDNKFINDINNNSIPLSTVMYEAVFNNNQHFNLSLPDEYVNELNYLKKNIDYKLQYSGRISNYFKNHNNNDIIKFLKEDIQTIVSVLLVISIEDKLYERLDNLLNNNLNINKFYFKKNKNIEKKVNDAFNEIKISKLSNKIFKTFVRKNKMKIISFNSEIERYNYLENTYKDIMVIDRLFNINKKLNIDNTFFHYISSAPYKTHQIFDSLKQISKNEYNNFNRNINQLFILNHIINEKKDENINYDTAINYINFIKTLKEYNFSEIKINLNDSLSSELYFIHKKAINNYIKLVENNLFIAEYSKIKEDLDKLGTNNSVNNDLLNRIIKKLDKYEKTYSKKNIDKDIYSFKSLYKLSSKFIPKNNKNIILSIQPGRDIIKNSFHHLPYVPFINFIESKNIELIKSFYEFLNVITNKPINSNFSINVYNLLINVLEKLSNFKNRASVNNNSISFIILSLLNIMTKSINYEIQEKQEEISLIKEIEDKLEIYKSSIIKIKISSKKIDFEPEKDNKIIKEIEYILISLYRRNRMFDKIEKIIEKNDNIKDVRFYHNIGLMYHSLGYNCLKNITELKNFEYKYFEKAISNLNKAKQMYIEKLNENKINIVTMISMIKKQIIAINNSLIDLEIRLNTINNQYIKYDKLTEIRKLLLDIKKYYNDLELDISNFGTINHTEAELEYYEAEYFYQLKDYKMAYFKINRSTERILNFRGNKILVPKKFENDIISKVNKLRIEVYKKLGYI